MDLAHPAGVAAGHRGERDRQRTVAAALVPRIEEQVAPEDLG